MSATRPSRIIRHAVMALAVAALLAAIVIVWIVMREPPEISRSRGISLGMTRSEVVTVMGPRAQTYLTPTGQLGLLYGDTQYVQDGLRRVMRWLGIGVRPLPPDVWPVCIRLDKDDHVDQIRRVDKVEEAPMR